MTEEQIETLPELLAKATPGPWEVAVTLQHEPGSECMGEIFPPITIERYEIYTAWENGQAKAKVPVVGRSTDERFLWLLEPDAALIALAPDLAAEVIRLRAAAKEAALQIDALKAREAAAVALVTRYRNGGCPDCSGDCSAASPPVFMCIMDEARAFLAGGQS